MQLRVQGIASQQFQQLQAGGPDANHQSAVLEVADGGANPCRHCLGLVADGEELLILSYRPFERAQPYAESGPIFLHKKSCERYDSDQLPAWFAFLDPAIIRGYNTKDWIAYETGNVVAGVELTEACMGILDDPEIAYVHIRSKFNCFQCRVERA